MRHQVERRLCKADGAAVIVQGVVEQGRVVAVAAACRSFDTGTARLLEIVASW
jgi:hypothetical protein